MCHLEIVFLLHVIRIFFKASFRVLTLKITPLSAYTSINTLETKEL